MGCPGSVPYLIKPIGVVSYRALDIWLMEFVGW